MALYGAVEAIKSTLRPSQEPWKSSGSIVARPGAIELYQEKWRVTMEACSVILKHWMLSWELEDTQEQWGSPKNSGGPISNHLILF